MEVQGVFLKEEGESSMMSNHDLLLKTGDWIKGKSMDGELIIGYIESFDHLNGTVKVTVITSDHKLTIGKTIHVFRNQIKQMPVTNVVNKEQIRFLIDLALITGDVEWFNQLSSQLNSMLQLVSNVK